MNDKQIINEQSIAEQGEDTQKLRAHTPAQKDSTGQQKNRKHKFITKIKIIAPQATRLVDPYASRINSQKIVQLVTTNRQRNNEAAKKSRRRSKIYTELLQEQITNIELDLFQTNDEIEMLRTEIFNALMHTDENKKNAETQSHILKKLKGLVRTEEGVGEQARERDTQINICLDSSIYRIGASGSERKAILDILYTGFINRNLPNIYRYILWSAVNGVHLFQNEDIQVIQDKLWSEIKDIGEQIIKGHEEYLKRRGQTIRKKGRQILKCSKKILKIKRQIEKYGQCYDSILKQVRQILTPVQFAELFLFVERSIHKKQLRLLKDENQERDEPIILKPEPKQINQSIQSKPLQRRGIQLITNRRIKADNQNMKIKSKQDYFLK